MRRQAKFFDAFWDYLVSRTSDSRPIREDEDPAVIRAVVCASGDIGFRWIRASESWARFGVAGVPDFNHLRAVGAHDAYLLVPATREYPQMRLERIERVATPNVVVFLSWNTLMSIIAGEATLIHPDGTRQFIQPFTVQDAFANSLIGEFVPWGFPPWHGLHLLKCLIEACSPELRAALGVDDDTEPNPIAAGEGPTMPLPTATAEEARELVALGLTAEPARAAVRAAR